MCHFARRSFESSSCEARLHIFFRKYFWRLFDSICHAELSLRPRDVRSALCRIDASRFVSSDFDVGRRDRNVVISFCNTCLTHGHVLGCCTSFDFFGSCSRVRSTFIERRFERDPWLRTEKISAPELRLSAPWFPKALVAQRLERATPSAALSAGLLAKPSRRLFFPVFVPVFKRDGQTMTSSTCSSPPRSMTVAHETQVDRKRLLVLDVWFQKRLLDLGSRKQRGSKPPSEGPSLMLRSAAHFWRAPRPGF